MSGKTMKEVIEEMKKQGHTYMSNIDLENYEKLIEEEIEKLRKDKRIWARLQPNSFIL